MAEKRKSSDDFEMTTAVNNSNCDADNNINNDDNDDNEDNDLDGYFEFSYEDLVEEIENELRLENEHFANEQNEEVWLSQMSQNSTGTDGFYNFGDLEGEGEGEGYSDGNDPSAGILCPVCKVANIVQNPTTQSIMCTNNNCIKLDFVVDGLGIEDLRGNLAATFGDHGMTRCPGALVFDVKEDFGIRALVATCSTCGVIEYVL